MIYSESGLKIAKKKINCKLRPSYLDLDLVLLLPDIFYSSFIFSLQVSLSDLRDCFLKQLLIFYSLTIPSPDEEREREVDLGTFVDKEEVDIDDESDVELDLDLDSEHNEDDLESDTEIVYSPI